MHAALRCSVQVARAEDEEDGERYGEMSMTGSEGMGTNLSAYGTA